MTRVDHYLGLASELFGIELVQLDAISKPEQGMPWRSEISVVKDPSRGKEYIYKFRSVNPYELLEIETVLRKLAEHRIPNLCPIVGFKLFNHRIHLLMEYVRGISLDHSHDEDWNNEPMFRDYLDALPVRVKVQIAHQLLESLRQLHQRHLVFQDLKIEQIILESDHSVVFIDLDTIVTKDGLCASHVMWVSPVCTPPNPVCCEANDVYQAGCVIFELFTGKHLTKDDEPISIEEIDRLVWKMTNRAQEPPYITSAEVLSAISHFRDQMM